MSSAFSNAFDNPWMGCLSIAGLPPSIIYTPGWRESLRHRLSFVIPLILFILANYYNNQAI